MDRTTRHSVWKLPQLLSVQHRQRAIYRQQFRRFGQSHRSLKWTSRAVQERRFEVFLAVGDLTGRRILDVGCGFGDFFAFLDRRGIEAQCVGYDIVDEFVAAAAQKVPHARFERRNLVLSPPNERFDYVFCSGIFALGSELFFRSMLEAAFARATVALGFNLFQTPAAEFFSQPPEQALEFCRTLGAARVELVEGYLPDDYTVFLFR